MKIADEKVVAIHYTLKNNDGIVLDSSANKEPLTYLHGRMNIIPGLEKALMGKTAGDKVAAVIQPEEAYGVRQENMVQVVNISNFQQPEAVKVGAQFQIDMAQGPVIAVVKSVQNDEVTLDMNHPLADEILHFDVEVIEVRDATNDELSHGHVHGPGGHHH